MRHTVQIIHQTFYYVNGNKTSYIVRLDGHAVGKEFFDKGEAEDFKKQIQEEMCNEIQI